MTETRARHSSFDFLLKPFSWQACCPFAATRRADTLPVPGIERLKYVSRRRALATLAREIHHLRRPVTRGMGTKPLRCSVNCLRVAGKPANIAKIVYEGCGHTGEVQTKERTSQEPQPRRHSRRPKSPGAWPLVEGDAREE